VPEPEPGLILVTGATGNVGAPLVDRLRASGARVRAAGSRPSPDGVRLDFRAPETFGPALAGVRRLFLLRPPAIADVKRTLLPFLDAAASAGVEHVVFLSVAGAGRNKLVPHHAVEAALARSRFTWTVLRPGFFAQNLATAYRADVRDDDRLYVPAGRGRVAFVDTRDVAEVAALALLDPDAHARQAYTLTGPEAISFAEVATILSEALGRPIRYRPASVLGYARHLGRQGLPAGQIAVQTILHVGLRFGQAERVDPTLERLLGRRAGTVRDFVRDHSALWTRA
jgi:uncharacterized protein YbjT (DUF2867 family)